MNALTQAAERAATPIGQASGAAVDRLRQAMENHRRTVDQAHEVARALEAMSARTAVALAVLNSDPSDWHAFIEAWFNRHISGSIVSRDTAIYNHVRAAKDELKGIFG